jgi:hypothetical protein
MDSVITSVHHGVIFILDPRNRDVLIPEIVGDELVIATDSCISVLTQASVDGEVEVSLAFSEAAPPGLVHVARGNIRVPHGTLTVDTADEGVLFERDVPKGRVTVSIWVDDMRHPERVFINVERALGAI